MAAARWQGKPTIAPSHDTALEARFPPELKGLNRRLDIVHEAERLAAAEVTGRLDVTQEALSAFKLAPFRRVLNAMSTLDRTTLGASQHLLDPSWWQAAQGMARHCHRSLPRHLWHDHDPKVVQFVMEACTSASLRRHQAVRAQYQELLERVNKAVAAFAAFERVVSG